MRRQLSKKRGPYWLGQDAPSLDRSWQNQAKSDKESSESKETSVLSETNKSLSVQGEGETPPKPVLKCSRKKVFKKWDDSSKSPVGKRNSKENKENHPHPRIKEKQASQGKKEPFKALRVQCALKASENVNETCFEGLQTSEIQSPVRIRTKEEYEEYIWVLKEEEIEDTEREAKKLANKDFPPMTPNAKKLKKKRAKKAKKNRAKIFKEKKEETKAETLASELKSEECIGPSTETTETKVEETKAPEEKQESDTSEDIVEANPPEEMEEIPRKEPQPQQVMGWTNKTAEKRPETCEAKESSCQGEEKDILDVPGISPLKILPRYPFESDESKPDSLNYSPETDRNEQTSQETETSETKKGKIRAEDTQVENPQTESPDLKDPTETETIAQEIEATPHKATLEPHSMSEKPPETERFSFKIESEVKTNMMIMLGHSLAINEELNCFGHLQYPGIITIRNYFTGDKIFNLNYIEYYQDYQEHLRMVKINSFRRIFIKGQGVKNHKKPYPLVYQTSLKEGERTQETLNKMSMMHDSFAFSPSGSQLAIASNIDQGMVLILMLHTWQIGSCFKAASSQRSLCSIWVEEDYFCVGFEDGDVILYNKFGYDVRIKKGIGKGVTALDYAGDEAMLALDESNVLSCFATNPNDGKFGGWFLNVAEKGECSGHFHCGLKLSNDSRSIVLSGDCSQTVSLYQFKDPEAPGASLPLKKWTKRLETHIWNVAWTQDDEYVLALGCTQPAKVYFLRAENGEKVAEYCDFKWDLNAMVIHPWLRQFLVADDHGNIQTISFKNLP
jgi:hypothetical protein